jgi:hypothetical protein
MEAQALIDQATAYGVTLAPRIWADKPDLLPMPLRDAIKLNQFEIVRLLIGDLLPFGAAKALDAIERAAIASEHRPVERVRARMTSWSDHSDEPVTGDHCGCCKGQLWWSEADISNGWRCAVCHPHSHLAAYQIRAVAT